MSTRSTIAIEFADGSVSQVYCHHDGYLSYNGRILAEHYSDPFKVRALVDLGGFSILANTVEETAKTAYVRTNSEGVEIEVERYMNLDEYYEQCQQQEYDYILRNVDGVAVWFVRCYATEGVWVPLGEAKGLEERMNESECY